MSPRTLKPNVINVFDNAVVQVNVVPKDDEIDVDKILDQVMKRFEFNIGVSFDLQFLSIDGKKMYALRRYCVTEVDETIQVSEVSSYQTMTKNVTHRKCSPITDLIIFDKVEGKKLVLSDVNPDIDRMSIAELQGMMKSLTGKGFKVGTEKDDMVVAVKDSLAKIRER